MSANIVSVIFHIGIDAPVTTSMPYSYAARLVPGEIVLYEDKEYKVVSGAYRPNKTVHRLLLGPTLSTLLSTFIVHLELVHK